MEIETSSNLAEAIREIQETAILSAAPKTFTLECPDGAGGLSNVPVAFLPGENGVSIESLLPVARDGAAFAREQRLLVSAGPDRREGSAAHQSLASLVAHANRFKAPNSAVWADPSRRTLVSVLDYHPEGATSPARWGKHRGTYQCPLSEAWLAWGGGKALELSQDAFAALLDSRDRELICGKLPSGKEAPDPATLITLASNLEVFSTATAKRERDPNTGRLKISFSEDKGVNGTVLPPPSFLLGIPVFQDSVPEPIEVRLRVTVSEGHALFSVQIHAAGDVLRAAFESLQRQVQEATELPVFVGTPE